MRNVIGCDIPFQWQRPFVIDASALAGMVSSIEKPMLKTLRAFRFLFIGPLLLGFLVIVNVMTSPGHWWVQWAALGIGIAWVISLFRVIYMMILAGGLVALIALFRRKPGPDR